MPAKIDSMNLLEALMFVYMQTIKFMLPFFLKILQKYCKLVILVTLGMSSYMSTRLMTLAC